MKQTSRFRGRGFAILSTQGGGTCEICILAGGLSRRMGRNKARLRLGKRTMLGHIRAAAQATGLPVRVISQDYIPGYGPLGGVYTGLNSSGCASVLFLACDMPFVRPELLRFLLDHQGRRRGIFTQGADGKVGFPFILRETAFDVVFEQMRQQRLSLQDLAMVLKAKLVAVPPEGQCQLTNVNTPQQWQAARRNWNRK